MAAKSKIFGYWISSVDEKSAKEAAKMAGLPVLLLGANALILALSGLVNQSASMTVAGSYLTMALCLSFIAFRIRAGHAGWIPLAGLLFLVFIAVSVLSSYLIWQASGAEHIGGAQVVMGWVVPLICLVFVFAGLKSWIWLRANGFQRTF